MLSGRILRWTLVVALGLAPSLATAHGDDGGDDDGRIARGVSRLLPPEGGPQPLAKGYVLVEAGIELQRLEIEVLGADPTVALEVFLLGEGGVETSLGSLPEGNGELEFGAGLASTLPLGASTVSLLAGLQVEVRDGGAAVVLAGAVPSLTIGHDDDDEGDHDDGRDDDDGDHDDGKDDDDGDDDAPRARGRAILMLADTSPFAGAEGRVEVETEGEDQELEIEVEDIDTGTTVEFFLDDGSGTMASLGTATTDAEGEAEIEFDTGDGDALPLGLGSVADLAGRRVEVRVAAEGTVILFGEVPEATVGAMKLRCREAFRAAGTRARAVVVGLLDNRSGRARLGFELKAIARGSAEAELLLDDGEGNMTVISDVALRRSGRGRARWDTKRGGTLPLGVTSVLELEGRPFEIRVEGETVLSGRFPRF